MFQKMSHVILFKKHEFLEKKKKHVLLSNR